MKNKISTVNRTPKSVKVDFIKKCIEYGFEFGGIVKDTSIKGLVEFNLITVDEHMNGFEIKGRKSQFCLYAIKNGRSERGVWYDYSDAHFDSDTGEFWVG